MATRYPLTILRAANYTSSCLLLTPPSSYNILSDLEDEELIYRQGFVLFLDRLGPVLKLENCQRQNRPES